MYKRQIPDSAVASRSKTIGVGAASGTLTVTATYGTTTSNVTLVVYEFASATAGGGSLAVGATALVPVVVRSTTGIVTDPLSIYATVTPRDIVAINFIGLEWAGTLTGTAAGRGNITAQLFLIATVTEQIYRTIEVFDGTVYITIVSEGETMTAGASIRFGSLLRQPARLSLIHI